MFIMHVPKTFWFDAVQTATYLMNRLSTRVLSYHTPLEILSLSSSVFSLPPKTFGCICFVNISKSGCTKLDQLLNVCFWVMHQIRNDISVITLLLGGNLCQGMSHSLSLYLFSHLPRLLFRGSIMTMKVCLVEFHFQFLSLHLILMTPIERGSLN